VNGPLVWGGEFTDALGAQNAKEQGKHVMQWDADLYGIEEKGDDLDYFINHSCDSNTWMKDAYTLVARRDIEVGEEITADYALWEADPDFISKWECHCGSPICRHKVTGKDWQLPEIQERYTGHFSPLINKKINTFNRHRA